MVLAISAYAITAQVTRGPSGTSGPDRQSNESRTARQVPSPSAPQAPEPNKLKEALAALEGVQGRKAGPVLRYKPSDLDRAADIDEGVKQLRSELFKSISYAGGSCRNVGQSSGLSDFVAKFRLRVESDRAVVEDIVVDVTRGPQVTEEVRDCVGKRIPSSFLLSPAAANSKFEGGAEIRFDSD